MPLQLSLPPGLMAGFERHLADELEAIREAGLWRELRRVDSVEANRIKIEGREYLNFSSNDYLGLAGHPALGQAAKEAVEKFGVGSGASRLICGSLDPHHELEAAFCLLYTSPSPRDKRQSRMPSSA